MFRLSPATLKKDGFATLSFEGMALPDFQAEHQKIYGAFLPGENANNKLARAIRWGVFAHDQFIWFRRNSYRLSKRFNKEEDGNVRRFGLIPETYLRLPEIDLALRRTFAAWSFEQTTFERAYEVQLSAIRYEPTIAATAIPAPIFPHQDMVDGAVVVTAKTGHLMGGASRLYTVKDELPLYEIDLAVGEALLIRDTRLKHQVTPMMLATDARWRPGQRVFRDILIIRYQPLGR
jgi:hypothetical protein